MKNSKKLKRFYCHLCRRKILRKNKGRHTCLECSRRVAQLRSYPVSMLLEPCYVCNKEGSWLMEIHDDKTICANCHRAIHRPRAASPATRLWPRQCQIDMIKIGSKCKVCKEMNPDKLVFVQDDEEVFVSSKISIGRLMRLLVGTEVYCYNCIRTERRNL